MQGFLSLHKEKLKEDWLDEYGHLNEAYYLVAFSNANWSLQDHFSIGKQYFKDHGGAIYTVETHLRYLAEVRAPATLDIQCAILAAKGKKLHFAHAMYVDGILRATFEGMMLHVDSKTGKTSPVPDHVIEQVEAEKPAIIPDWIGRSIAM